MFVPLTIYVYIILIFHYPHIRRIFVFQRHVSHVAQIGYVENLLENVRQDMQRQMATRARAVENELRLEFRHKVKQSPVGADSEVWFDMRIRFKNCGAA